MKTNMTEYMIDVKCQLYCNATEEFKNNYTTYLYTNEQVDENIEYFEKCKRSGLSAYKALLFFVDYLNDDYEFK